MLHRALLYRAKGYKETMIQRGMEEDEYLHFHFATFIIEGSPLD